MAVVPVFGAAALDEPLSRELPHAFQQPVSPLVIEVTVNRQQ